MGGRASLIPARGCTAHNPVCASSRTRRHQGHRPLPGEARLLQRHIDIHQHDDKKEQHHDAAHIQNDLHGKKEFRVLQEENSAHGKERHNQPNCAVHSIAPRNHHNRGDQRHDGKCYKCDEFYHVVNKFKAKG